MALFFHLKKVIVSILAVLYMTASSGMTIHVHYCMGKAISVSFREWNGESHKCPNCGMHQKKGCCDEKETLIKIEKEYNTVQPSFDVSTSVYYITLTSFIGVGASTATHTNSLLRDPSESLRSPTLPIFIRNSVFRI